MGNVVIDMSMSLDGYIAAPNDTPEQGLGEDGMRLHKDGNRVAPAELGLPQGIPEEVRHVVTFTAIDGSTTELIVREYGYRDAQIVEISRARMERCLDQMATSLAKS